jgi:predicted nucleotidyltransferase
MTLLAGLDSVLEELVAGAVEVLEDDLCGVYMLGSLALGDFDVHSDVDFLVVTHEPLSRSQEAGLREMHARLPEQEPEWSRHLEGSYVDRRALRSLDPEHRPWLYVDNGSRAMEWSAHDNTAVMRWTLRERGVVLIGPVPTDLVDPVAADDLRREVNAALDSFPPDPVWWAEGLDNAWAQPYVVATICRMLFTLDSGEVASKRVALEWAAGALDAEWAPLIHQALDDRPDPWLRVHRSARPGSVERTRAFVDYALTTARAERSSG